LQVLGPGQKRLVKLGGHIDGHASALVIRTRPTISVFQPSINFGTMPVF
jgi:hypothetical protein